MYKKIGIIIVVVVILGFSGFLIYTHRTTPIKKPSTSNNSTLIAKDTTTTPDNLVVLPPLPKNSVNTLAVKVEKIQGQNIFFIFQGKEKNVIVTTDTKLTKQVTTKGVTTEVPIKLSNIMPSQIIAITFATSSTDTAKSITVLK